MPIAVSPDCRHLLYSMYAQPVRLLDVATGGVIAQMRAHQTRGFYGMSAGQYGGVRAVGFAPDGRVLITGGEDGVIRFWQP
jgi:WD40 repeat protein